MTTIALSPANPKIVRFLDLLWTANATRFTTTMRGRRALPQDQGVGHKADMTRLQEHMATMTPDEMAGAIEFQKVMEGQKR